MKLKIMACILLSVVLSAATAWAGLTKTEISQLYVSVFNRASEGEGNAFWRSLPDMAAAAAAMLDTQAAKDYFGANLNTNQAFIEHIYLNTLNKTIADDAAGISYWVGILDTGTSRGNVVATLVGVIKDYAPGGPYYNPDDAATVRAYNQFTNRVAVSDYMADTVHNTPEDWATSTAFSSGLVVTDDLSTVDTAKAVVDAFNGELPPPGNCGAYIAPGVWKDFDCYNLAAIGKTTNDDPFTPSWRLIGGYWQWGRKGPDPSQWYDTNTSNFAHGPQGPGLDEANNGSISGWDTTDAPNGSWSDTVKTVNDPCPAGYRVPTLSQWAGVLNNNMMRTVGSWTDSALNYSSADFAGTGLMLPAAGRRNRYNSGSLVGRGLFGHYWSTTENYSYTRDAYGLFSNGSRTEWTNYLREDGLSVRCIAEEVSPECTYRLSSGGGSFTSTGGTGSFSVIASSPGCAWTTENSLSWVTLSPSGGSGNEIVTITVDTNPGAGRTGSVTIAGQTFVITQTAAVSGAGCGAYVAPGVWKEFDCYNLAAIGKITGDDPFTPSWRLTGGYWQWGRKGPSSGEWYNTNTPNFAHGPTGPESIEANKNPVSGWDQTESPGGSWSDTKTADDPCPEGFRMPAITHWEGVINNNPQRTVGSWSESTTNYNSARFFGDDLMLPAAGFRVYHNGSLDNLGCKGYYWSATGTGSAGTRILHFGSDGAGADSFSSNRHGFTVRCIAE